MNDLGSAVTTNDLPCATDDPVSMLAPGRPVMITARVLAGLVAAAVAGTVLTLASTSDPLEQLTSPIGLVTATVTLAAIVVVGVLTALLGPIVAGSPLGRVAWPVAMIGSTLVAGGYWSSVFVQPGLAAIAPAAVVHGIASVTAGFVLSYGVLGLGWIGLGLALRRVAALGLGGWVLVVTAVLCLSPLPYRFVPLAITLAVVFGRRRP